MKSWAAVAQKACRTPIPKEAAAAASNAEIRPEKGSNPPLPSAETAIPPNRLCFGDFIPETPSGRRPSASDAAGSTRIPDQALSLDSSAAVENKARRFQLDRREKDVWAREKDISAWEEQVARREQLITYREQHVTHREQQVAYREQQVAYLEQLAAYREKQAAHREEVSHSLSQKLQVLLDLTKAEKAKLEAPASPEEAGEEDGSVISSSASMDLESSSESNNPEELTHRPPASESAKLEVITSSEKADEESSDSDDSSSVAIHLEPLDGFSNPEEESARRSPAPESAIEPNESDTSARKLWYDPVGADVILTVPVKGGKCTQLPLHRRIVEPRCGWLRQQISQAEGERCSSPEKGEDGDESDSSVIRLYLDVECSLALSCFYFAYIGGQSEFKWSGDDTLSRDQVVHSQCFTDNLPGDYTSAITYVQMYDAALLLDMPELCCHVLERMAGLVISVADSADSGRRNGELQRSDFFLAAYTLEAAMHYLYLQDHEAQWRPMEMAFAAFYDSISMKIGPYLTLSRAPHVGLMVQRLQEDYVEYRQLQGSFLPTPGSLVRSVEDMKMLLDTTLGE
jgi:hypothetical protein